MSESCPNCGSRPFMDGQREWLCGTSINYPTRPSTMCRLQAAEALIRILREELAEAHGTIQSLIAAHYDELPHISGIRPFAQVMDEYVSNEHRSNG